jgi:hypothetical protein
VLLNQTLSRAVVLLGPVKALGEAGVYAMAQRAELVRTYARDFIIQPFALTEALPFFNFCSKGMSAVADTVVNAGTSARTKRDNPTGPSWFPSLSLQYD